MKICQKCGKHNPDSEYFCSDCDTKLGDSLSADDEKKENERLSKNVERLYNRSDPLYVSVYDKVFGSLAIASLVLSVVFAFSKDYLMRDLVVSVEAMVLLAYAIVEAFFPMVMWSLEKLRMSYSADGVDNLHPSRLYYISRKVTIALFSLIGVAIVLFNVADFRHPPVRRYIYDFAQSEKVDTKKWDKIIKAGDYSVDILIDEIREDKCTTTEQRLMMDAVIEITGMYKRTYSTADEFLAAYDSHRSKQLAKKNNGRNYETDILY